MKLWHYAAIAVALGIAYVLIKRPTVTNVGAAPSTSNAYGLATSLVNLGSSIYGKLAAPSAVPPDAATNSYNNISTSDLDALRASDAAAGVEGPF